MIRMRVRVDHHRHGFVRHRANLFHDSRPVVRVLGIDENNSVRSDEHGCVAAGIREHKKVVPEFDSVYRCRRRGRCPSSSTTAAIAPAALARRRILITHQANGKTADG